MNGRQKKIFKKMKRVADEQKPSKAAKKIATVSKTLVKQQETKRDSDDERSGPDDVIIGLGDERFEELKRIAIAFCLEKKTGSLLTINSGDGEYLSDQFKRFVKEKHAALAESVKEDRGIYYGVISYLASSDEGDFPDEDDSTDDQEGGAETKPKEPNAAVGKNEENAKDVEKKSVEAKIDENVESKSVEAENVDSKSVEAKIDENVKSN